MNKKQIIFFQLFILFFQLMYCLLKSNVEFEIFIFPILIVGLNFYSSSLK